jgi:penicillin amidase
MRWLRWTLFAIAVVAALSFAAGWWALRLSLPPLDGEITAAGPGAPTSVATIERDAAGRPTITARTRSDLAWATGFAHGQDRFFQMDLSRRLAAGELSELFGAVALSQDTRARRFAFRQVAQRVIEAAPDAERDVIEAYARGVNAGVASLRSRPWEYLLLRAEPRPWAAEDSVLVVHSMWWQLQYGALRDELERRRLERAAAAGATEQEARELIAFVHAGHSEWDTPNYTAEARCIESGCARRAAVLTQPFPALLRFSAATAALAVPADEPAMPGSNGWAVAGIHTKSGVALIANDMHLDLGVPAVWYPARLRVTGAPTLDITGVTLPGTPAVAAGSNGGIAWAFTNSYGDFADARWGACAAPDYSVRRETIRVRGATDAQVEFREVGAGVVMDGAEYAGDVAAGECLQVAWLATRPEATNFALLGLERARTVDAALALAPGVGIPGQNAVIGDVGGRIAWTLLGRVPRGAGPDRLFGPLEFRDVMDHPRIADPPVGRLWTANQRVVEGALEVVLGDDEVDVGAGGYDIGARARQIRDRLLGLPHPATEADMLAVQLDSRAVFIARWSELLLALLDEAALAESPARRGFRELISEWKPEASPDSVGYRLVREFRGETLDTLWNAFVAAHMGADARLERPAQFEAAGWRLVAERPVSIAPPGHDTWRAFLLARVDATIQSLSEECSTLATCTYGKRKPVAVRHPLSRAAPLLPRLLDMPTLELAGDHHMPRVQDGQFGASERFAVSPGREASGYLQLPGGPSGHPLSPFYRSGFADWVDGKPTPFLPGPTAHTLTLQPAGS